MTEFNKKLPFEIGPNLADLIDTVIRGAVLLTFIWLVVR